MNQLCEASLPDPDAPGQWTAICINEATEAWLYACVHEHVKVRVTCDEHRPPPGEVGCRECWDAGHDCELIARQVSLADR